MKAALKFIMTLVGLTLIGLNVATVLLLTQFEGTLRDGLTRRAGEIVQGEVHLEAIRFDWPAQALVLKGISVFNPKAFTDREALRIDSIQVRPRLLSIFARTPVIDTITLSGIDVHLQYRTGAGTNIGAMQENARQYVAQQAAGERWVLGRPLNVGEITLEPLQVHVKGVEPPTPEIPLDVAGGVAAESGDGEAGSGARVILLVLESLTRQIATANGLADPVRELLTEEVSVDPAPPTA